MNVDFNPLGALIRSVYAEAWVAGSRVAADQVGMAVVGPEDLSAIASGIDWSTWTPGDPAAALKAADGGLRALLDQAGITIKGIENTTLDQIGNQIAAGLSEGLPDDAIARAIRDFLDDPSRADMIANTETSRAMMSAQSDQYQSLGFAQFDWIAHDGCCDECQEAEDENPHDFGDDEPPAHPMCRCGMVGTGDTSGQEDG